jgi:adenylate kinase
MGPPGSGKSTQADLLADELGIPHFKTGDLFHYLSQEDTPQGREIKRIMESGELVEDELTLKVVEEHLVGKQYQNGMVLDGTPRNLWQAKNFKIKLDKVIYLQVSDQENIRRLIKRSRVDTDKPAVIKKRLEVYRQETHPMLAFYRGKGILEEVDGERPIEVILKDILARLKN